MVPPSRAILHTPSLTSPRTRPLAQPSQPLPAATAQLILRPAPPAQPALSLLVQLVRWSPSPSPPPLPTTPLPVPMFLLPTCQRPIPVRPSADYSTTRSQRLRDIRQQVQLIMPRPTRLVPSATT